MTELHIKSKFWIEDPKGRPVFGGGRAMVLQKIDELGSIQAAADELKMSYRAVLGTNQSHGGTPGHETGGNSSRRGAQPGNTADSGRSGPYGYVP